MRAALRQLPPLLKAYLRMGGMIGEGAVIDQQFNTIDVCLVLPTERVQANYQRHYRKHRRAHGSRRLKRVNRSPLRGAVRGISFLALTGGLLVLYLLAMALGTRATLVVRRLWCRGTAWLLGVRITLAGRPFTDCPTLLVANHVSYLDVLALGAFVDGTFIAKSEVAGWPLFGTLGKLTRTLFVRRHWRRR